MFAEIRQLSQLEVLPLDCGDEVNLPVGSSGDMWGGMTGTRLLRAAAPPPMALSACAPRPTAARGAG